MALIEGIKIDGNIIKESLNGISDLARGLRVAITGKVDPQKALELESKIVELEALAGKAQTDINLAEASNPNGFVSGWRPYIGWICGTSLAVYYIPQALIGAVLWLIQCVAVMRAAADIGTVVLPVYPVAFNVGEIIGLVLSLLGLGTLRTAERFKGVARS